MNASTDSGDVSQIMPMNLFTAASWPVGVAPHTWQATACSGSTLGEKSAHWAAGVMAATAYDILTMPEEREKIRKNSNPDGSRITRLCSQANNMDPKPSYRLDDMAFLCYYK